MEFRLRLGLLKGGDFIFLSPSRFVFSLKQIQDFLDDFFVNLFFLWGREGKRPKFTYQVDIATGI